MRKRSAKNAKEMVPPLYTVNTRPSIKGISHLYMVKQEGSVATITGQLPWYTNRQDQHLPGLKKGRGGGAPKRTGLPQGTPAQGTKIWKFNSGFD